MKRGREGRTEGPKEGERERGREAIASLCDKRQNAALLRITAPLHARLVRRTSSRARANRASVVHHRQESNSQSLFKVTIAVLNEGLAERGREGVGCVL